MSTSFLQQLRDTLNERRLQEAEDLFRRADEARAESNHSRSIFLRELGQRCLDQIT